MGLGRKRPFTYLLAGPTAECQPRVWFWTPKGVFTEQLNAGAPGRASTTRSLSLQDVAPRSSLPVERAELGRKLSCITSSGEADSLLTRRVNFFSITRSTYSASEGAEMDLAPFL